MIIPFFTEYFLVALPILPTLNVGKGGLEKGPSYCICLFNFLIQEFIDGVICVSL